MRWRLWVLVILLLSACGAVVLLWQPRAGNLELWRMRVNIRKADPTRPISGVQRKVEGFIGQALGEGTNGLRNALSYEKQLLAAGRLSTGDFPLALRTEPQAYQSLWKELSDAAPGAHFSPQGTAGPTFYVVTNLHVVAAVEDLPRLAKVIAVFNSVAQPGNAQKGLSR
jgi:hypothetical protein